MTPRAPGNAQPLNESGLQGGGMEQLEGRAEAEGIARHGLDLVRHEFSSHVMSWQGTRKDRHA